MAPLLICALLALPGCGVVESVAKRTIHRVGGAVAGLIFGSGESGADDAESADEGGTSVAGSGGGFFEREDEEPAAEARAAGFFKIVEPNGTVRFVSNLSQVPASQRPEAERLAMEPASSGRRATRAAPARRATPQLAAARDPAPAARAISAGHDVVIYTTAWCGWCTKTRAWLDQNGVDYENRDIEANAAWAAEMHELTGSGGVPVIVIDGEVIKGFNQSKMEQLLRG
jgi:glutaredoxin-like YruB-family protein